MKVHNLVCTGCKNISSICLGQFTRTVGLPCPHQPRGKIKAKGTLSMYGSNPQSHLKLPP